MKSLKTLFVVFSLICMTLHSRPSQAAVGAIAAAPAAVTAGLYIAGAGGAAFAGGIVLDYSENAGGWAAFFVTLFVAIPLGVLGLIVLEDEQALEFATLGAAEAQKLGVTQTELRAFNNEIDQINALAAYVDAEVSKDEKPSKEFAAQVWEEVRDEISPDAFSGLVKVNNQLFKKK